MTGDSPLGARRSLFALAALVSLFALSSLPAHSRSPDEPTALFDEAARVLEERCVRCHGETPERGGLSLATREALIAGGDKGPALEPKDLAASRLLTAVHYDDPDLEMPPTGKISPTEIAALERWILAGAPWPEGRTLTSAVAEEEDSHLGPLWGLDPVTPPLIPAVSDRKVRHPIDAFLAVELSKAGLELSPLTDRATLLRRLTYDLTGLPPTPEEIAAFVTDDSEDAYERRVDALLASEQYGLKWGRHWLDLVRFAETDSYERDRLKPGAWRYRDWVIDAFNRDLPYDQFLIEQIAGDELPDAGLSQLIATGYHRLGIWDDEPADRLQAVYDDLDGILDTTCRVTMAVSMGCARCHDHKGDPLPTRDYYRSLAFFEGLRPYKQGGGNATTPENYLRDVPAELSDARLRDEIAAFEETRRELIDRIEELPREVRARWPEESFDEIDASRDEGLLLSVDFEEGTDLPTGRGVTRGEGRRGAGGTFAGGDSGLEIPRPVTDDFTISLWFRTEEPGAGGNRDLRWFRGTGIVDGEVPGVVSDFGLSLVGHHVCAGSGAPETFIHSSAGVIDGEWHHVALTRTRSTGELTLWLDGSKVDSAIGGTQPFDAPKILRIGRMQPGYNSFRGDLDEVQIWERALDDAEIVDLALGGSAHPQWTETIAQRLGEPEAARHRQSIARLAALTSPERKMVSVLCAMETGPDVAPSFVRERGNANALGESVEPGFPELLGGGTPTIVPTAHSSGRRLAFARWLTDPTHPRTARVMANRLWQHHFGQGLVETPNDFGRLGSSPSHPELLDWLAHELVERKWSLKAMHRVIVTSHAYRQSSAPVEKALVTDPNNRLLWRFSPRRLTAEEIRDSILAVNGTLNRKLGGPGVYPPMPKEVLATSSRPGSAWGRSSPEDAARRSVYIHVKRSLLSPLLVGFDLADTDTTCPVRFATTQPTQALTLLNSEFSQVQAAHFADRLEKEHPGDRRAQVIRGLELARQRPADRALVDRQLAFLDELSSNEGLPPRRALELFALVLINLNEFLYVD